MNFILGPDETLQTGIEDTARGFEQETVAYWRQWTLPWAASPGRHRLTARAHDGEGVIQTEEVTGVLPDGPTGYHSVEVNVR